MLSCNRINPAFRHVPYESYLSHASTLTFTTPSMGRPGLLMPRFTKLVLREADCHQGRCLPPSHGRSVAASGLDRPCYN